MLPADTRFGFCEFSRRAGDFAIAMALVTYRVENGVIERAARGDRRRRAAAAPDRGSRGGAGREGARRMLSMRPPRPPAAIDPLEDAITSADYRRDLARAVTRARWTGAA